MEGIDLPVDMPPGLPELSVKLQIYGGVDLLADLPPGLPELSVKWQIYRGDRSASWSATWSAKFEHALCFMLRFTEVFSTKNQCNAAPTNPREKAEQAGLLLLPLIRFEKAGR